MPTGSYPHPKERREREGKQLNTPESIIKRSTTHRAEIDDKVNWDTCWSLWNSGLFSTRALARMYGISKSAMHYRLKQIRLGLAAGENANHHPA